MTATSPTPIMLAAGAIPFNPANYQSTVAMGGYGFPYADTAGSIACLNGGAFCGAGSTATAAGAYGAGLGVNLNQMPGATGTPPTYTVPPGKLGVAYGLTNLPAKMIIIIDNNIVPYQAPLATMTGMVPWAMFTVQTPDAGPPALSGPPKATHINFQQSVAAAAGSFNFCVTSLSFY